MLAQLRLVHGQYIVDRVKEIHGGIGEELRIMLAPLTEERKYNLKTEHFVQRKQLHEGENEGRQVVDFAENWAVVGQRRNDLLQLGLQLLRLNRVALVEALDAVV